MSSKVLQQLERAMLWEIHGREDAMRIERMLREPHPISGWAYVGRSPVQFTYIVPGTFCERKAWAINSMLDIAIHAAKRGHPGWTTFPANGTRASQLAWLRHRGFRAEKAEIRIAD